MTGKSSDTGLLKSWPANGPALLWEAGGIGDGFSSAVIAGGLVYITGDNGNQLVVTALDMQGKLKWQAPVGEDFGANYPGSRSTPSISDGKLYLVSGAGDILCLDAGSGKKLWAKRMQDFGGQAPQWGYTESVLVFNDLAIVTPGGDKCIVALDKKTGQEKWHSTGFNAPAHYGSCIPVTWKNVPMIVAGTGGGLFGVSANDGHLLWRNDFSAGNTANCPTPAFSDGYVFWANGYGKGGICLKLAEDGKGGIAASEAWRTNQMDCHHGGYVIVNGYIYGNHGGGWTCLDMKTGAVKWNNPAVGKGSLCYADGMLYLFGESGGRLGLGSASPDGFTLAGELKVNGRGSKLGAPGRGGRPSLCPL